MKLQVIKVRWEKEEEKGEDRERKKQSDAEKTKSQEP